MLIPVYCKKDTYYIRKLCFNKHKTYYVHKEQLKEHFKNDFNVFVFHDKINESGLWVNDFSDRFTTNKMYLRSVKLKHILL